MTEPVRGPCEVIAYLPSGAPVWASVYDKATRNEATAYARRALRRHAFYHKPDLEGQEAVIVARGPFPTGECLTTHYVIRPCASAGLVPLKKRDRGY